VDERRTINRRRHERRALPAAYTSVEACRASHAASESLLGHAYDLSESGLRIELDEALPPGEPVQVRVNLPGDPGPVAAHADVVWVNDEADDPGPRRMALRFTDFVTLADRERLMRFLGRGLSRAAA
jgi:hypothetical protein